MFGYNKVIKVPSVNSVRIISHDPNKREITYASSCCIYSCHENGEYNRLICKLDDNINSIVEVQKEEGIYIFSIFRNSKTLYFFNAIEEKLEKIDMEDTIISKLCKHPDPNIIISITSDSISLIDIQTMTCIKTVNREKERIVSVNLLDNDRILLASSNGNISIWNTELELIEIISNVSENISLVTVYDNNRIFVVEEESCYIQLYDITEKKIIQIFKGNKYGYTINIVVICDGLGFISTSYDNSIRIWDIKSGICIYVTEEWSANATTISLFDNNTKIICGLSDKWEPRRQSHIKVYNIVIAQIILKLMNNESLNTTPMIEGYNLNSEETSIINMTSNEGYTLFKLILQNSNYRVSMWHEKCYHDDMQVLLYCGMNAQQNYFCKDEDNICFSNPDNINSINNISRARILCLFKILYHKYIYFDIQTIFQLIQLLLYEELF